MGGKLVVAVFLLSFIGGGCASTVLNSQKVELKQYESIGSGIHYFLPKGFIKLRLTREGGNYALGYVETVYTPDYENLFLLTYEPVSTSEDDVKIDITDEGLMDKITVTSKEKTGEIVIKIVELAKEAAKAVAPLPLKAAGISEKPEVVKEFVLDLTDQAVIKELNEQYLENKFTVELKRPFDNSAPPSQEKISIFYSEKKSIYYRPLLPYTLKIMGPDKNVLVEQIVLLPNEAPVLGIDVTRAALVEKVTELDFKNGTLQSIHIKKPSETLAFMEIPLSIVKGILSVPAEIIKIKIDYSSKNKQLIDAYKAELKAREELEKLRQELRAPAQ
jgi:hypothetical protein